MMNNSSLFSVITTLYALVLLYFPCNFSRFLLSPVLFFTLILLLYLLQLGAEQRSTINPTVSDSDSNSNSNSDSIELNSTQSLPNQTEELLHVDRERGSDESSKNGWSDEPDPKQDPRHLYTESFVEWDLRAPLEVIYEEYEGEDAGENDSEARRESQVNAIRRYASLSLFYPESDSDASSEGDFPADRGWESPDSACFRWEEEEEDDRDGLIEIALDQKRNCEVEEDNLIEINLSPAR